MPTRRRWESTPTTSLRPAARPALGTPTTPLQAIELAALVYEPGVERAGPIDSSAPTVEMLTLAPIPEDEDEQPVPVVQKLARGSEPVRRSRGTRRSRELIRVEDIKRKG